MIGNDRQYKTTRSRRDEFRLAIDEFDSLELIRQGIDPVIAEAQRKALQEQLRELDAELERYDALRSGAITDVSLNSVERLGDGLVEARIGRGLSQRALAGRLGMKEQQIQRYEQDRYQTASLARIAEIAGALSVGVTINVAWRANANPAPNFEKLPEFQIKNFPLREMKKRGWLRSDETHERGIGELFRRARLTAEPYALHRQHVRSGGKYSPYSMLAWKARVLGRAREVNVPAFDPAALNSNFIKSVVQLSQHPTGPALVVERLREKGIVVLFERHLPETHLDGAAMLLDGVTPVIALTLRYDRLDNFWFVLLHELAHVVQHREAGLRDGFFDDESSESTEVVEQEADDFARNALVSDEVWKASFVRFAKSPDQVIEFARKYQVGPAVVAGRIQRERNNYGIFKDLIGVGGVRSVLTDAGLLES